MITREEAKEHFEKASDNSLNYHDSTEVISIHSVNIILNEIYDSFEQQIKEHEEDFMSQGQIAQRALLIGYEDGWFEWKGDAENGGNHSSIETDLKKIRDNTKIYGYIKMMNAHTDVLKNKIEYLESQLSSNPLQLNCDGCMFENAKYVNMCDECIRNNKIKDQYSKKDTK